ncbi:unnamed protein product, partial [Toxocara canis]|uniref:DNA_MISMATCH_REPAIR_2 domain-containing protein n=1 Tax=Toxocara canis TaxID=6265 RepID=A0A183U3Q0_TOXCA
MQVPVPCVVYGDLHGQYSDLHRWFNLNGWPWRTRSVFLGDFVDRGSHGIEVVALLTAMKAGKTTYLKRVCLLQVLAQTGCFVPADFAAFPIITRIFSRIGHNDDLSSNLSAFAVEVDFINLTIFLVVKYRKPSGSYPV